MSPAFPTIASGKAVPTRFSAWPPEINTWPPWLSVITPVFRLALTPCCARFTRTVSLPVLSITLIVLSTRRS